jgi:hypothetical protein
MGLVVAGMTHQGFQVSLGEHRAGQWIAVFYSGRGGHDPIAAAGTAQEPTPSRAVHRAALERWSTGPLPRVRLLWRSIRRLFGGLPIQH